MVCEGRRPQQRSWEVEVSMKHKADGELTNTKREHSLTPADVQMKTPRPCFAFQSAKMKTNRHEQGWGAAAVGGLGEPSCATLGGTWQPESKAFMLVTP